MSYYLVHIETPHLTLKAKRNVFPVWSSDGPRASRASTTQQSGKSRQGKSWQGGLCDENVGGSDHENVDNVDESDDWSFVRTKSWQCGNCDENIIQSES